MLTRAVETAQIANAFLAKIVRNWTRNCERFDPLATASLGTFVPPPWAQTPLSGVFLLFFESLFWAQTCLDRAFLTLSWLPQPFSRDFKSLVIASLTWRGSGCPTVPFGGGERSPTESDPRTEVWIDRAVSLSHTIRDCECKLRSLNQR